MLLTAGFFASKTLGVDFDPLQKGPLGQDRLRTWSEESKHGRMFICFVGLILASYVRHICEAFDFPIPDCCAPAYVSKSKQTTKRRGRPAKPKAEKQTF